MKIGELFLTSCGELNRNTITHSGQSSFMSFLISAQKMNSNKALVFLSHYTVV